MSYSLAGLVDEEGVRGAVALSVEGGFVVARDGGLGLVAEAGEYGTSERDVVGSWGESVWGGRIEG